MTAIEWTDVTWNPTIGCRRISPGCANCYAEHAAAMVNRTQGKRSAYLNVVKLVDGDPRWTGEGRFLPDRLGAPLHWRKPRRVFVDSMSDLFYEKFTNEEIAAVFGVMAATPHHTYQVLTKRPERMREWFDWIVERAAGSGIPAGVALRRCGDAASNAGAKVYEPGAGGRSPWNDCACRWPLPNVWIGVSVENQAAADERIPHLLATPAAVRFLSCEPLLGSLDLTRIGEFRGEHLTALEEIAGFIERPRLDWIIAGCESGPGARAADAAWYRSLRDQCAAAGVPFFLKQATEEGTPDGDDEGECTVLAGPGSHRKPGAGGVIGAPYLDGVQHLAWPEVRRG